MRQQVTTEVEERWARETEFIRQYLPREAKAEIDAEARAIMAAYDGRDSWKLQVALNRLAGLCPDGCCGGAPEMYRSEADHPEAWARFYYTCRVMRRARQIVEG